MILNELWPTTLAQFTWDDQIALGNVVNDIIMKFPDGISDHERPDIDEYSELKLAHEFIDNSIKSYLESDFPKQKSFSFNWWVHVYRQGATHHIHNHLGSQFTGILYLATPPVGGELVLHDPRGNANRGYNSNLNHIFEPVVLKPQAGDLFIFPSFVWHNVETVKDMRICMPFDVWC
jgi:hypothetical protein